MEITITKIIPRKIFVLIIAKISNPLDIFFAKICVMVKVTAIKIRKISIENKLKDELIMKNQNEKPAVTASDLNRGEEVSMLYWIDKCN